ncbi:pentapeptide repeat-containing protein [Chloroflexota bacterium]
MEVVSYPGTREGAVERGPERDGGRSAAAKRPLSRNDIVNRIEGNGGVAEGLDLSREQFEAGIDLSGLDLHFTVLERVNLEGARLENADLWGAHLGGARLGLARMTGADLWGAHLERANLLEAGLDRADLSQARLEESVLMGSHLWMASLVGTRLENADLRWADLRAADISRSHLEGADLRGAKLDGAEFLGANLEGVDLRGEDVSPRMNLRGAKWGGYVLKAEGRGDFAGAEEAYLALEKWHRRAGLRRTADNFRYRRMEARRKAAGWRERPLTRLRHSIRRLLYGYGERPTRALMAAIAVILVMAGIYGAWGSFASNSFTDCLCYSAASFTALGYGIWASQPEGWAVWMGAVEGFVGVTIIALFLVALAGKLVRKNVN